MAKPKRLFPEILFHFTNRLGLFGILENNFSISYASENIVGSGKSRKFAVPMVSFCDLRLSELKLHMDKYGNYGLGLRKEWANKNGLNPVLYMSKHCPSTVAFINAVGKFYDHLDSLSDGDTYTTLSSSYMDILNLYRYIKNYEGDLTRKSGKTTRNYRFADEREWRYVPPLADGHLPFVPCNQVDTPEKKAALNATLANRKLVFGPEDIQYLIVAKDFERSQLIDHLEHAKRHFDETTRRRLASRILTADQIVCDV